MNAPNHDPQVKINVPMAVGADQFKRIEYLAAARLFAEIIEPS